MSLFLVGREGWDAKASQQLRAAAELDGLTFVTTLDRASDLNRLLDALPGSMRINPNGPPR